MPAQKTNENFEVIFPQSGRGIKEIEVLYKKRKKQLEKSIAILQNNPTDFRKKGIEKINNSKLGQYTIRVSKGDRLFYDVDRKLKRVHILRAGKHDLYKLG